MEYMQHTNIDVETVHLDDVQRRAHKLFPEMTYGQSLTAATSVLAAMLYASGVDVVGRL